MITGPYKLDIIEETFDVNTVEEIFDVILKIALTFKMLINVKTRYFKCEGYGQYDYQCPSESQHVRIVSSDDVDDSKVIEDVYVPSKNC